MPDFFDSEKRLIRLSGLEDQLEAFSRTVDFGIFRSDQDMALAYVAAIKASDPVLLVKFLVTQRLNNLS